MPKKEIINITLIHVIMSKFVDSLAKLKKKLLFLCFRNTYRVIFSFE